MSDFFMRCDTPHPQAFSMLDTGHVFLLLVSLLVLSLLLFWTAHAPKRTQRRLLYAAGVLVPLLELSHSVWMYLTGTTRLVQLLPLHLCGLQSLFIPLSIFTRFSVFKDFVFATSLLGGIFGTVLPAGVADYYLLFSFQTIQTIMLHGLLIYVPLAQILSGRHRPDLRRFHHVLCLFLAVVFVVGFIDFHFDQNYMFIYVPLAQILSGRHRPDLRRFHHVLCLFLAVVFVVGFIDFHFDQNYMFLFAPPEGTPLVWVFDAFGRQIYLLVTFLLLSCASVLVHLPFCRRAALPVHSHQHN